MVVDLLFYPDWAVMRWRRSCHQWPIWHPMCISSVWDKAACVGPSMAMAIYSEAWHCSVRRFANSQDTCALCYLSGIYSPSTLLCIQARCLPRAALVLCTSFRIEMYPAKAPDRPSDWYSVPPHRVGYLAHASLCRTASSAHPMGFVCIGRSIPSTVLFTTVFLGYLFAAAQRNAYSAACIRCPTTAVGLGQPPVDPCRPPGGSPLFWWPRVNPSRTSINLAAAAPPPPPPVALPVAPPVAPPAKCYSRLGRYTDGICAGGRSAANLVSL